MGNLDALLTGLGAAMSLDVVMYCFFGVFIGTLIGVLPGIGALATISLLLPVSYHIPPAAAIIMLAGVYYGAQYGGSTSSILLNLPGTPSHAVTCLDGHPMAKQGRAAVALFMTTIASFVGSMVGLFFLALFSPAVAEIGLNFGAPEYFSLMLLGLVAASTMTSGSAVKGLSMVVLGLFLGTVGTDVNTGVHRFHFGIPQLMDGINFIALAMGVFGVSEVISSCNGRPDSRPKEKITFGSMLPTWSETKRSVGSILRGTGVGGLFGALPGTGPSIASFMAYALEKKVSKDPSQFGTGAIEGLTGPEAANNAASQTSFIPTLSLGIPGDAVMALMLTALIIHGIQPGPMLLVMQPDLFWLLIAGFFMGNIMLLVLNIPLIGLWVSILRIPYHVLYPAILIFIALGVYSVNNSTFDILMVAFIGAIGYAIWVLRFDATPLLLGFVLGPLIEANLRRALLISRGDPMTFLQRPISATILGICMALLLWTIFKALRPRRTKKLQNAKA
ncbi:tripartite tricarboxylate transporter permease [Billgrantia sp. Q4P2]|uniref:tripartite tricarboxylate transporter permease n=1 Tax=Billgrantia sp. Q4P2 TaxID=3463857 RepID=UPI0040568954